MWFVAKGICLNIFFQIVICALPKPFVTELNKCGKVHLTVSSLGKTHLELNWIPKCNREDIKPEKIALYGKDPYDRDENLEPKVLILAGNYPDGYYETNIKFGHPWLPGNWEYEANVTRPDFGPHCFPYWIASLSNNNTIIDAQCLRINPTWITDNSNHLRQHRIANLFIPGSHNSGSFRDIPLFERYVRNQDRSVWTQLVFGIRYLDLRVGYYGEKGFYLNHDIVRVTKLLPVLREIRRFSEIAPKELIILDFHRFPYPSKFTVAIHEKLIALLKEELGDLVMPSDGAQVGRGPSLENIWGLNKSIIICYGQEEFGRKYNWLWNPIRQFWGNKRTANSLKWYLQLSIPEVKNSKNPLWALMAELTPQTADILLRTASIRQLADMVNRYITMWFRDEWAVHVNIVATDYFLGNDIINVAIDKNKGFEFR